MGASLKDIAKELRISTTTVSWVLSNQGTQKRISKATQDKILRCAAEMNYRPNLLARSLNTGRTGTIGLILPSISDAFYSQVAKAVETEAEKCGYTLMICSSESELERENRMIRMFKAKQVDGMQVIPHRGDWKEAAIPAKAEVFKSRPIAIYQGIHRGHLPKSGSFMKVDGPNVCVTAVKKSESGDDMIIRCVEMFGEPATATIHFPSDNFSWTGKFVASEIKTLRYSPKKRTIKEVNLLEE